MYAQNGQSLKASFYNAAKKSIMLINMKLTTVYLSLRRFAAFLPDARFQSKRNRLRCVRCVWMETGLNASACVGKRPIMVATTSIEHPIGCCLVSIQTKRTQRTQRKRFRLNGKRA